MFPVRLSSSTAVMLELERIFAWHITNEVSIPAARGFYHFETQPSKTVNIVSMIVLGYSAVNIPCSDFGKRIVYP
jgi:hypothetical protein